MESNRRADPDELLRSYFRSEVAKISVPPAPAFDATREDADSAEEAPRRNLRHRVTHAGIRVLVAAALAAAVSVPLWYDPMSSPGARVAARYFRETGNGEKIAHALADIQRFLRANFSRQ